MGNRAVTGVKRATDAAARAPVVNPRPPAAATATGTLRASGGSGEMAEPVDGGEAAAALPAWYKQPSAELVTANDVFALPGLKIKRRAVSDSERDAVRLKDESYVASLHKLSSVVQKEAIANVVPSEEALAERRGPDAHARHLQRAQLRLPRNRAKVSRASALADENWTEADEALFSVAQLKLALMAGDLGASAPKHELTHAMWHNVCRYISLPATELHSVQTRVRPRARIGQRPLPT